MKKIVRFVLILALAFGFQKSFAQKAVFDHVSIYVKDLQKSTAFYKNVMHLDTIPEPFHDGRHTWLKIGEGLQMHLIAGTGVTSPVEKENHICFSTPSIKAFAASLTKAGIPYGNWQGTSNAIQMRADGVQQIYFTDPDGYWIEVNDMGKK
jgi:lactoylglutathione lyase